MKQIPLTQGKVALVDDEDFKILSKHKWIALKDPKTWYAGRGIRVRLNVQRTLRMHRQILGLKRGEFADHRDGNGLNNQRYNLRICTNAQNCMNRQSLPHSSKFKGVHFNQGKWKARILRRHLGYFYTEEAAALAYNEAAKVCFGEFAKLNVL